MEKSQVVNDLGNEIERAYKICDDTTSKRLKILYWSGLEFKMRPSGGGKGPESIRKKKRKSIKSKILLYGKMKN